MTEGRGKLVASFSLTSREALGEEADSGNGEPPATVSAHVPHQQHSMLHQATVHTARHMISTPHG